MTKAKARTPRTGDACRRCDDPLGSLGFCPSCSAAAAAVADEVVSTEDQGTPSRVRRMVRWLARWRAPIVVVPLLVGLTAVGAMGAQMLTAEIAPAEPVVQVTCWDGGTVDTAAECAAPSGEAGLRWVFPSFRPGRDGCVDALLAHPEYARPAMYECDVEVAGAQVTITYTELAGVDPGRRYFQKQFAAAEREGVRTADGEPSRYVWRQRTDEGHELVVMYTDFPYAVEITTEKAAHRDRALRQIDFRHPDKIRVAD